MNGTDEGGGCDPPPNIMNILEVFVLVGSHVLLLLVWTLVSNATKSSFSRTLARIEVSYNFSLCFSLSWH